MPKDVIKIQKTFYDSGKLKTLSHITNGKLDGPYEEYFEKGQLKIESNKKGNWFEGEYKEYYPNGQLKIKTIQYNSEAPLKNILWTPYEEYYEHGTQKIKKTIINNYLSKFEEYYDNGSLKKRFYLAYVCDLNKHNMTHDFEIGWTDLNYNGEWINMGKFEEFYPSGHLKKSNNFNILLKKKDDFTGYFEDGKIQYKGDFTAVFEDGTVNYYVSVNPKYCNEYYENGSVKSTITSNRSNEIQKDNIRKTHLEELDVVDLDEVELTQELLEFEDELMKEEEIMSNFFGFTSFEFSYKEFYKGGQLKTDTTVLTIRQTIVDDNIAKINADVMIESNVLQSIGKKHKSLFIKICGEYFVKTGSYQEYLKNGQLKNKTFYPRRIDYFDSNSKSYLFNS